MADAKTVVAEGMKERLQLYLNETDGSVIAGLREGWRTHMTGMRGALHCAQSMGGKLARAKQVLERFGDSWEEWVETRSEMGIVPFSLEQAERLIRLHELDREIKLDDEPRRARFVATLTAEAIGKA